MTPKRVAPLTVEGSRQDASATAHARSRRLPDERLHHRTPRGGPGTILNIKHCFLVQYSSAG